MCCREAFNQQALYAAYEKRADKIEHSVEEYEAAKAADPGERGVGGGEGCLIELGVAPPLHMEKGMAGCWAGVALRQRGWELGFWRSEWVGLRVAVERIMFWLANSARSCVHRLVWQRWQ